MRWGVGGAATLGQCPRRSERGRIGASYPRKWPWPVREVRGASARFSSCDARCHSARAAYSCALRELRLTSCMRGGMPALLAMSAWVVWLSMARHSNVWAACAWAFGARLASHSISGGMPPVLAMAIWLAVESFANEEHAMSTRTARSGALAAAEPRRPTSLLAISARLSRFFAARAHSAPDVFICDLSVVPVTRSPSNGSMPPSLAMVSLFCAWSVASDQIADADRSFASSLPSRTRLHKGATAPVRPMAASGDTRHKVQYIRTRAARTHIRTGTSRAPHQDRTL